jgi:LacI family transcriptional regulator
MTLHRKDLPVARKASLKRIAELADVSTMTVSRALRDDGLVAVETARRIREIAERLRYRPNKLVHGLRTGRTDLIAGIFPSALGFYADVLGEIEHSLDAAGKSLLLNLVSGDQGEKAMREELRRLHRCIELRVDGIVLRPVNDNANSAYFNEVVERGVPIVVIDRRLPDFDSDFVGTDNVAGGKAAAELLLGRGCRNLLVLYAGEKVSTSRERRDGFVQAVAGAGLDAKAETLDCEEFKTSEDFLNRFFQQRKSRAYDGVFAVGDHLARAAYHSIVAAGRRCPEEVKVVGFGHLPTHDPESRVLTTFDQNPRKIGAEAIKLLFRRLEFPLRETRSLHVPFDLIEGDTA